VIGALLAVSLGACPCYTLSSSPNTYQCGVEAVAGTNPSLAQWQASFALVSQGPAAWGGSGPAVATIGSGCGKPTPSHQVQAQFPCELLKPLTYIESGWRQFCPATEPADQVGQPSRTIISFDCGYGIGQITSGMHIGDTAPFDRLRVASDPLYNLATGGKFLADKWRSTPCVGDNLPPVIEHWYNAVWAYNGQVPVNDPAYTRYSSTRGVWNPAVGGGAPYQEKVFGRLQYPPDSAHWASLGIAYPNPALANGSGRAPTFPEPDCASPTDCVNKRSTHVSGCIGGDAGVPVVPDAGVPDAGAPDAGAPDAGPGTPVALSLAQDTLGTAGCGCSSSYGFWPVVLIAVLLAAGLARRRRPPRR